MLVSIHRRSFYKILDVRSLLQSFQLDRTNNLFELPVIKCHYHIHFLQVIKTVTQLAYSSEISYVHQSRWIQLEFKRCTVPECQYVNPPTPLQQVILKCCETNVPMCQQIAVSWWCSQQRLVPCRIPAIYQPQGPPVSSKNTKGITNDVESSHIWICYITQISYRCNITDLYDRKFASRPNARRKLWSVQNKPRGL